MKKSSHADYTFMIYVGILIFFGLLVLSLASVAIGVERFDDPNHFLKRQIMFGLLPGIVAFLVCSKIPYQFWKKHAQTIFGFSVLALVLVLIPGIGASFGTGARSWINFGFFSVQPAELVKLGLIIFLAAYITQKGRNISDWQSILWVPVAFLVLKVVKYQRKRRDGNRT